MTDKELKTIISGCAVAIVIYTLLVSSCFLALILAALAGRIQ